MDADKFKARQERTIQRIEAMIAKIEKADTLRLVLDGEELLHDFDMPGDIYKTMQKIKAAVIEEFKADIEDIRSSTPS